MVHRFSSMVRLLTVVGSRTDVAVTFTNTISVSLSIILCFKDPKQKQIKSKPTQQENAIKSKISYPNLKILPVLMGHRFFFLCACGSDGLILPLSLFLSPCLSQASSPLSISLLAPYKLNLSLWLYLSQAFHLYFYRSILFLFLRTANKPIFLIDLCS